MRPYYYFVQYSVTAACWMYWRWAGVYGVNSGEAEPKLRRGSWKVRRNGPTEG